MKLEVRSSIQLLFHAQKTLGLMICKQVRFQEISSFSRKKVHFEPQVWYCKEDKTMRTTQKIHQALSLI